MEATYTGVSSAEGASEVGGALLGVACAVLLRAALEPIVGLSHSAITYFVFLSAAVVVAAVVGFSPALLTLVFGAVAAWALFVPPRFTFPVSDLTAVSSLGIYLLTGPAIIYLASSYRVVTINAATAREMTARVERLEQELAARTVSEPTPASIEERFRTPADEMKGAAIYLLDDRGHNATWNKGVRRTAPPERPNGSSRRRGSRAGRAANAGCSGRTGRGSGPRPRSQASTDGTIRWWGTPAPCAT